MPEKVLFDHCAETGITEYYSEDPETGGFTIETVQDVTNLVEINQFLQNENTGRFTDLTHVASIPNVILMELSKQGIVSPTGRILDDKKYRAWLNDRDNRCFRTKLCRV